MIISFCCCFSETILVVERVVVSKREVVVSCGTERPSKYNGPPGLVSNSYDSFHNVNFPPKI
jgi:hypothetical protein